jgi:hypothetical protein
MKGGGKERRSLGENSDVENVRNELQTVKKGLFARMVSCVVI